MFDTDVLVPFFL